VHGHEVRSASKRRQAASASRQGGRIVRNSAAFLLTAVVQGSGDQLCLEENLSTRPLVAAERFDCLYPIHTEADARSIVETDNANRRTSAVRLQLI
jgi:hypothetical protein